MNVIYEDIRGSIYNGEEIHHLFTPAKMAKKANIVLAQLSWKGRS